MTKTMISSKNHNNIDDNSDMLNVNLPAINKIQITCIMKMMKKINKYMIIIVEWMK